MRKQTTHNGNINGIGEGHGNSNSGNSKNASTLRRSQRPSRIEKRRKHKQVAMDLEKP